MEFLVDLARIIGEKVVDVAAKTPQTSQSEKVFQKTFFFLKDVLTILIPSTSVLLPMYVIYSSYIRGILKNEYFYIGIVIVSVSLLSILFAIPKYLVLNRRILNKNFVSESAMIEDEINYEIGLEGLLAALSVIPILNLILFPLIVDRALNIVEITANNPKRQKLRELAENIAFGSMLLFLVVSAIVSIGIVILGDARNLR